MSKTIASLITLILSQFVPVEEIELVIEAVIVVYLWYLRYKAGDISLFGVRK